MAVIIRKQDLPGTLYEIEQYEAELEAEEIRRNNPQPVKDMKFYRKLSMTA